MKRLVLMIIPALICGMIFVCGGCKESAEKPTNELDLLFTVDDIKVFKTGKTYDVPNGGTFHGEIVFTNFKADDFLSMTYSGHYATVNFSIGKTLLFDPPIKIFNPYSSFSANDLQMSTVDDNFCLIEFYQLWEYIYPVAEREAMYKAQEKNAKMRKKQLDVFFEYLRDTGKLVKE